MSDDNYIIYIIAFLGFLIFATFNGLVLKRISCGNEAKAMELNYEYNWNLIGANTCVYILPNGDKVLASKYRVNE